MDYTILHAIFATLVPISYEIGNVVYALTR